MLSDFAICGRPWPVELLMQSKNACFTALSLVDFFSVREDFLVNHKMKRLNIKHHIGYKLYKKILYLVTHGHVYDLTLVFFRSF